MPVHVHTQSPQQKQLKKNRYKFYSIYFSVASTLSTINLSLVTSR